MPIFSDENIERLFGAEDAETETEERFKQYFFFSKTYENLISNLPIRILVGHKGIGKSALLKRAHLHDKEDGTLSVWLRPSELSSTFSHKSADFNKLVEHWKAGIVNAISQQIISDMTGDAVGELAEGSLGARVGTFVPLIVEKLRSKLNSVTKTSDKIIIENFLKTGIINVYIDDIDRGWSASKSDIQNISALINAMRDISGDAHTIRFRLGLRSDVYFLVRTSDESTDKIERNVIWLNWTNHEILCIIAKRIETFFGIERNQEDILSMSQALISTSILSKVIEPAFLGAGHWSNRPIHHVLLSLTRRRPRDLVKLMHGAAKRAFAENHNVISSRDLESTFESYSNERMQDVVNEFKSELPEIEKLLLNMKARKRERRTSQSFLFTNDALSKKITEIMGRVNLQFSNKRPVSGKAIVQFLYKIDFITARKDIDGRIDRKYFDNNRFLANEFVDFGYDWEIHPAYRWALNPQDIQHVIDTLDA